MTSPAGSAAYLRSCACVKTCGDVAATDDHPQAVCKGLAVTKEPLVEIVLVHRG